MKHVALALAALITAGIGSAAGQDAYVVLTPENVQSYRLPDTTTLELLARARILDATGAELGSIVGRAGRPEPGDRRGGGRADQPIRRSASWCPMRACDRRSPATPRLHDVAAASELQALPRWE